MSYTLVYDIGELVVGPSVEPTDDSPLKTETNTAVVIEDGVVTKIGDSNSLQRQFPADNAETAIDGNGRCALPGFVDAHTHALFVGDRSDEFEAKLRGKSYQEILSGGGGILRTVRQVRAASEEELAERLRRHLDIVCAHGTTTVEVKSGYGLSVEDELTMLRVIDRVAQNHPIDVIPTFMGAHAIPENAEREEYVQQIIGEQLPAVERQGIAEFCDVFCEEDAFTSEQSRSILESGARHGLTPKIHADEFERLGGAQVAHDLSAASADHLLQSTDADAAALVDAGVTPVMLPGTAFGLGGQYADPKPFLERGCIPAIASDFNPNCHSPNLGFAATLACVGMGLTPAEAILGITHRAAAAVNRTQGLGTLQEGAPGDLVLIDGPTYRHLPYNFGVDIVDSVMKNGEIVA